MKNSKRGNVDPFIVMDVMEAAREAEESGRRIIHMEVGQPGTPAPKQATNSVVESMTCLLYTSPSPRDGLLSRMPSSA